MVLMRARESFEDLEKRYNTRLANTGTKKGIAAIMSCHREVCETDGSHEGNDTRLRTRLIGKRNWRAGGRRGRRSRRVLNHSAEKVGGCESG